MTQAEQILQYLKQGNRITPVDALQKFGCFRLGARIWDLKKQGYNIQTHFVTKNNKTYAEYYMPQEKQLNFV